MQTNKFKLPEFKKLLAKPNSGIAIVYRPETEAAISSANLLIQWLKSKSHKVYTAPGQAQLKGSIALKSFNEALSKNIGLVVVLGGDGTYLRAVRMLKEVQIPILGVNLGSLGFLTTIRSEDLFSKLEATLEGKGIELSARTMMSLEWLNKSKSSTNVKVINNYLSLNDIVVERGPSSHLIDLKLNMEKHFVSNIKADAMVISSPTGSTAYNLAGGGPIVHPDAKVLTVTPVAAHSLTSRPLIFPDTTQLELSLQGQCKLAHIIVDGGKVGELLPGQLLRIKKHPLPHWMIQAKGHNYYELLREKLSFGERN